MSRQGRKRSLDDTEERSEEGRCILHYTGSNSEHFTFISKVKDPEGRWNNLLKIRDDRRSQPAGSPHRMELICAQIPATFSPLLGYHRDCYQRFTSNLNRLTPQQGPTTKDASQTRLSRRMDSATKDSIIFKGDCIFCNREGRKKVTKRSVVSSEGLSKFEKGGGVTILRVAEEKKDEKLLLRIRGFDLFACEAQFHPSCRTQYLQTPKKWRSDDQDCVEEEANRSEAHRLALSKVCQVISEEVIQKKAVVKLVDLNKMYIAELENTPHANPDHRSEKLKARLERQEQFANTIAFCPIGDHGRFQSYLVYSNRMTVGEAVKASYLLGCGDKIKEVAGILQEDVLKEYKACDELQWPPVVESLVSNPVVIPVKLDQFLRALFANVNTTKIDRLVNSLGQDLCRTLTNGCWKLPKHIILGMSLRHLFRSADLVKLMNRLGHCENYSFLLEIETAIATAVQNASSLVPVGIVRNPTCLSLFHSDFDNFDEFVNDLSGAGSVHRSHGIMLQELITDGDEDVGGSVHQVTQVPRTGKRSLSATPDPLPECRMGKRKSPAYVIAKTELDDGPEEVERASSQNLLWVLVRLHVAKTMTQTIPGWGGYISLTGERPSRLTTIEYYPIISKPITEYETVQECLRYAKDASREVGQKLVITSFDLGVCMKAYPLIWAEERRYADHIILIGSFHLASAYIKMIGKKMEGTGLADVLIEAGLISTGSLSGVLNGKNYARAVNCHKVIVESLERLLITQFLSSCNEATLFSSLPTKSKACLQTLVNLTSISHDAESAALDDPHIRSYMMEYTAFKDGARKGKHGKTAQLWVSYMDHVWLVLNLMRAVKTNNYTLYTQCLCLMPDLFFSYGGFNYARYLTYFSTHLVNIELSHPGATDLLKHGAFSVARSFIPGNRCPVDKTIEETFMRHSKSRGGGGSGAGLTGIQTNYDAYQRWCRTTKERAKYLQAAYGMADMLGDSDGDSGTTHRDIRPTEVKRGESRVEKTVETFENFVNPFDAEKERLLCVSSGISASPEVEKDILRAEEVGLQAKETFIKERLQKGTGFFDPIKKLKLKTFGDLKKRVKLKTSSNKEVQYIQQGNIAFQLLVKSQKLLGDKLDLAELMSYQLTPVPYSLALADGFMTKTDKSKGMHHLVADTDDATVTPYPNEILVIEDGNAVFHRLRDLPDNFSGIARKVLEESVLKSSSACVFSTDMYSPNSVKAMERNRRGVGDKLIVSGGQMKRPKDWKVFLSNDDNKVQLVKVLLDTWSSAPTAPILHGRDVVLVSEGSAYMLRSTGDAMSCVEIESLQSDQEETDTRVVLYCLYAQEMLYSTARVKTPDTDIFFILLHHARRFTDLRVLFETGKGRTKCCIDISKLAESYSPVFRAALLGLHAFTGCDSTSAFRSKGKVKALKLLEKHEKFHATFAELGESWTVADVVVASLEEFTCLLYGDKRVTKVNTLRHTRLLKKCGEDGKLKSSKKIDLSSLPPCQSSLVEHINRVNFQVGIWKRAHIPKPDIPDHTVGHGWTVEDGQIQPKWTGKHVLPTELVDILETMNQEAEENEDEEDNEEGDSDNASESEDDSSDSDTD